MPGTRGDERKDAHDNPAPRKRACPRFLPRSFDFKKGHGEKPGVAMEMIVVLAAQFLEEDPDVIRKTSVNEDGLIALAGALLARVNW